jgi:hypothetical protein
MKASLHCDSKTRSICNDPMLEQDDTAWYLEGKLLCTNYDTAWKDCVQLSSAQRTTPGLNAILILT